MKVLLTGSSGFLGKTILTDLSLDIVTLGRNSGVDIICDLAKEVPKLKPIDLVIHAAGKAHVVPKTELEKKDFHTVNVIGTNNLLLGLERISILPKSFVFISSVAVYGLCKGILIKEDMPLEASDPYGRSKIEAEQLIKEWCSRNNVICSILRLPLIIGTNPPGNLGSMIRGIQRGYYFNIDGGKARKSMVLSEDVVKIIPDVAKVGGVFNLTDGLNPSFFELSNSIATQLNKPRPRNMPLWIAKSLAFIGDHISNRFPINTNKLSKIISDLTFDDLKARGQLKWEPKSVLKIDIVNRKSEIDL